MGDEESVLSGDTSAQDAAKVSLTQDQKIEVLKRTTEGTTSAGSAAESSDAGSRAKATQ